MTTFNRYHGLEDATSFSTDLNDGTITITITATGDADTGSAIITSTYVPYPPMPVEDKVELQIDVSDITPCFNIGDGDQTCAVTVRKPNGDSVSLVDSGCKVECNNNDCLIDTSEGAHDDKMYFTLTPLYTTGVAIIRIQVQDSENNVGSTIVTILVKDPTEPPKSMYLHNILFKY